MLRVTDVSGQKFRVAAISRAMPPLNPSMLMWPVPKQKNYWDFFKAN